MGCHGYSCCYGYKYIFATSTVVVAIVKHLCFHFSPADFSVQFDPTSYTVDEADGIVSITIVADRPSSSTYNGAALFYTMNGTATGKRYSC